MLVRILSIYDVIINCMQTQQEQIKLATTT